jgi:hypothetical protein
LENVETSQELRLGEVIHIPVRDDVPLDGEKVANTENGGFGQCLQTGQEEFLGEIATGLGTIHKQEVLGGFTIHQVDTIVEVVVLQVIQAGYVGVTVETVRYVTLEVEVGLLESTTSENVIFHTTVCARGGWESTTSDVDIADTLEIFLGLNVTQRIVGDDLPEVNLVCTQFVDVFGELRSGDRVEDIDKLASVEELRIGRVAKRQADCALGIRFHIFDDDRFLVVALTVEHVVGYRLGLKDLTEESVFPDTPANEIAGSIFSFLDGTLRCVVDCVNEKPVLCVVILVLVHCSKLLC